MGQDQKIKKNKALFSTIYRLTKKILLLIATLLILLIFKRCGNLAYEDVDEKNLKTKKGLLSTMTNNDKILIVNNIKKTQIQLLYSNTNARNLKYYIQFEVPKSIKVKCNEILVTNSEKLKKIEIAGDVINIEVSYDGETKFDEIKIPYSIVSKNNFEVTQYKGEITFDKIIVPITKKNIIYNDIVYSDAEHIIEVNNYESVNFVFTLITEAKIGKIEDILQGTNKLRMYNIDSHISINDKKNVNEITFTFEYENMNYEIIQNGISKSISNMEIDANFKLLSDKTNTINKVLKYEIINSEGMYKPMRGVINIKINKINLDIKINGIEVINANNQIKKVVLEAYEKQKITVKLPDGLNKNNREYYLDIINKDEFIKYFKPIGRVKLSTIEVNEIELEPQKIGDNKNIEYKVISKVIETDNQQEVEEFKSLISVDIKKAELNEVKLAYKINDGDYSQEYNALNSILIKEEPILIKPLDTLSIRIKNQDMRELFGRKLKILSVDNDNFLSYFNIIEPTFENFQTDYQNKEIILKLINNKMTGENHKNIKLNIVNNNFQPTSISLKYISNVKDTLFINNGNSPYNDEVKEFKINTNLEVKFIIETTSDDENIYSIVIIKNNGFEGLKNHKIMDMPFVDINNKALKEINLSTKVIMESTESGMLDYQLLVRKKNSDISKSVLIAEKSIKYIVPQGNYEDIELSYSINNGIVIKKKINNNNIVINNLEIMPLDILHINLKIEDTRPFNNRTLKVLKDVEIGTNQEEYFEYKGISSEDSYAFFNKELMIEMLNIKNTETDQKEVILKVINDKFNDVNIVLKFNSRIDTYLKIEDELYTDNNSSKQFQVNKLYNFNHEIDTNTSSSKRSYFLEFLGDDINEFFITKTVENEEINNYNFVNNAENDKHALVYIFIPIKHTNNKEIAYRVLVEDKKGNKVIATENSFKYNATKGDFKNVQLIVEKDGKSPYTIDDVTVISANENMFNLSPLDLILLKFVIKTDEDINTITKLKFKDIDIVNEYFNIEKVGTGQLYEFNNKELALKFYNKKRTDLDKTSDIFKILEYTIENDNYPKIDGLIKFQSQLIVNEYIENKRYSINGLNVYEIDKEKDFKIEFITNIADDKQYEIIFESKKSNDFIIKTKDGIKQDKLELVSDPKSAVHNIIMKLIPTAMNENMLLRYQILTNNRGGESVIVYTSAINYRVIRGEFQNINLVIIRQSQDDITINNIVGVESPKIVMMPLETIELKFEIPNIENIYSNTYIDLSETSDLFEYFDFVGQENLYMHKFESNPLILKLINKKNTNGLESKTIKYEIINDQYLKVENEIRYESKMLLKYSTNNRDYNISRTDGINRKQTINIVDRITFKMNHEIEDVIYYLKFDNKNEYETYFSPIEFNEFNTNELTIPFTPIKVNEDVSELPFKIFAKKSDDSYNEVVAYESKLVYKTVKDTYDGYTIDVRVNNITSEPIDFNRINQLELKPLDKIFMTIELLDTGIKHNSKIKFLESEELHNYFDIYDYSIIDEKNNNFYEFKNRRIIVVLKCKKVKIDDNNVIKYKISNVDYASINKELRYKTQLILEDNINEIVDVNDKILKGKINNIIKLKHEIKNVTNEIPINNKVKYYLDFHDKSIFNEYFLEIEDNHLVFNNEGKLYIDLHPIEVVRSVKTIKYSIYAKEKDIVSTGKGILTNTYEINFTIDPSTYLTKVYVNDIQYDNETVNNIKVYDTINIKFKLENEATFHADNQLSLVNYNKLINHFIIKRKGFLVAGDTMTFNKNNEISLQFISKKRTSGIDNVISYSIKSKDVLDYDIYNGDLKYNIEKLSYNDVDISMKIKDDNLYSNARNNNVYYKNEIASVFIEIDDYLKGSGKHYYKIRNWEIIKNNFYNNNVINLDIKHELSSIDKVKLDLTCTRPGIHLPIEIEISDEHDNYLKKIVVLNTKIISRELGIKIKKDNPQDNIDINRRIDVEISKDNSNKDSISDYKFKLEKRDSSTVEDDSNRKITIKGKSNIYVFNTLYNITDDIINGESKIFFIIELQEYTIGRYDLILKIINTDDTVLSKPFTIENVGFFARLTSQNNKNSHKVKKNIELPIHFKLETNIPDEKLKWIIPEDNDYYILDTNKLNSANYDKTDIVIYVKSIKSFNERKFITIKVLHKDLPRYEFKDTNNEQTFEIIEDAITIQVKLNQLDTAIGDKNDNNKVYKGNSNNQWIYDIVTSGDENFEQKEYKSDIIVMYKNLNKEVFNSRTNNKHLEYIKTINYRLVNNVNTKRLIINNIEFNKIGIYDIDVLIREKNTAYISPTNTTMVKVYDFTPQLKLDVELNRGLVVNNVLDPIDINKYEIFKQERVTINFENKTSFNSSFTPEYVIIKSNKNELELFNENMTNLTYSNVGNIDFIFNEITKNDNFHVDIILKELNTKSQLTKRVSLKAVKEDIEATARIRKPLHNKDLENKKIKIILTNINSLKHISGNDLEYNVTPIFYNSSGESIVFDKKSDINVSDLNPRYNALLDSYFINYSITNLSSTIRRMNFSINIEYKVRGIKKIIYTNTVDLLPIETTTDIANSLNNAKHSFITINRFIHSNKNTLPLNNAYRFQIDYNHYSRYVEQVNQNEVNHIRRCNEYGNSPSIPLYYHINSFDTHSSSPIKKIGYLGEISFSTGTDFCAKLIDDYSFEKKITYYKITENVDIFKSFSYMTVDLRPSSLKNHIIHHKTNAKQEYYLTLKFPQNHVIEKNNLKYLKSIDNKIELLGLTHTSKNIYISNGVIINNKTIVYNYQGTILSENDKGVFLEKFKVIDVGLKVGGSHQPLEILKTVDTETSSY